MLKFTKKCKIVNNVKLQKCFTSFSSLKPITHLHSALPGNVMGNVQRFGQGANSSEGLQEVFNVSCFLDCRKMGGMDPPADFLGTLPGFSNYTLGGETDVTVTVKSALTDTQILNAFGVIKGFVDPGEDSEHTLLHLVLPSESVFSLNSACLFLQIATWCSALRETRSARDSPSPPSARHCWWSSPGPSPTW